MDFMDLHLDPSRAEAITGCILCFLVIGAAAVVGSLNTKSPSRRPAKSGWNGTIGVHYTGQKPNEYTTYVAGSYQIPSSSQIEWIVLLEASYQQLALIEKCTLKETTRLGTSLTFPYSMLMTDSPIRGLRYEFPYVITCPIDNSRVWTLHIHVRDSVGLREFYLSFSISEARVRH